MSNATFQVTFDAANPAALSRFWTEVLGYKEQDPPEGFESWEQWLVDNNMQDEVGKAAAIVDPSGILPRIYFQKVPEGKTAKNRVHLDVNVVGRKQVSDEDRRRLLEEEADRLVALGAKRSPVDLEQGEQWVVMTDPEGNEFCLQ